jgi:hypothetical protein
LKAGYRVDLNPYERYDSLLSQDDLELLFNVLSGFHDKYGNPPVITANCVVANPDFKKIKEDQFNSYHYELITETFKRYPNHKNAFSLWQEGIKERIFYPQYHCREHLNVSAFMTALRKIDPDVLFGFENEMPGCIPLKSDHYGNIYVESTRYSSADDKNEKLKIFLEGLDIFKDLFGYSSESVIPPNYIWSPDYNKPVFDKGVKYFQGIRKFREPLDNKNYKYHNFYLGKVNELSQINLIRNSAFEPSLFNAGINDPVGNCLTGISIAFKMNKPVIICSHRINYAGFIDEGNRDRNLRLLHQLLASVFLNWPDIEFMTSDRLGKIISDQSQ